MMDKRCSSFGSPETPEPEHVAALLHCSSFTDSKQSCQLLINSLPSSISFSLITLGLIYSINIANPVDEAVARAHMRVRTCS